MRSQRHGGLMILLLPVKTSTYGLHQLISDPTHILPNSSSCIDLIFTDQTNLVVDTGVHLSLHPNYHHQITYCKFNLFIKYPAPYTSSTKNHLTKLTAINCSKTKMAMNK